MVMQQGQPEITEADVVDLVYLLSKRIDPKLARYIEKWKGGEPRICIKNRDKSKAKTRFCPVERTLPTCVSKPSMRAASTFVPTCKTASFPVAKSETKSLPKLTPSCKLRSKHYL
ncbi:expressed conserved protein [Echinococcus multilocularis]|uniref:Expressed conserved protein n=1 Tax=Echinococcus multilocularis TaxID=6211 RepID=A0A068YEC9_ECHMU|nr:expressed conserved protein [Echinococcus multilocularis]